VFFNIHKKSDINPFVLIISYYTKFHEPNYKGSSVMVIKVMDKYKSCKVAMLMLFIFDIPYSKVHATDIVAFL